MSWASTSSRSKVRATAIAAPRICQLPRVRASLVCPVFQSRTMPAAVVRPAMSMVSGHSSSVIEE